MSLSSPHSKPTNNSTVDIQRSVAYFLRAKDAGKRFQNKQTKMAANKCVWEGAVEQFFTVDSLHPRQIETIQTLLDGKDVFLSIRTGGGKSLCYQSFNVAAEAQFTQRRIGPTGADFVLVISPLNTIMTEQVAMLNALGLAAACVGRNVEETDGILSGKYQYIYSSPEHILGNSQWREMLRSEVFKSKVGLIVVDEAHTVVQW